ncbi:hypothetical protein N9W34_07075 [Rickettsiales bacterium]|nr:hypothetical protein [Rickettsiales bacterium]
MRISSFYKYFFPLYMAIFPSLAFADEYTHAYNTCSPVAGQQAKRQCNYGRTFEAYYLDCMHKYGYDEEAENTVFYENYSQAYEYCSSEADSNTKEFCNYGRKYRFFYDKCMRIYGFNSDGQKIAKGRPPPISHAVQKKTFQFDF